MKPTDFREAELRAIVASVGTDGARRLFRAPGTPGYIEGATTDAGQFNFADEGFDGDREAYRWACDQIQAGLQLHGLYWTGSSIVGECGRLVPADPPDIARALARAAWDRCVEAWHAE